MTDMALEGSELESSDYGEEYEGYYGDESYDEGESFDVESLDDEASAAARRRRRRARQLELARRRRRARALALRRPGPARPVRSAQAAVAAVKKLDLETKVHDDEQRLAIAGLGKRMDRAEYAAVAGVGSSQLQAALQPRFPALANPYVRAAFAAAPLALLSPRKRGTGLQSLVSDPRLIGAGLSFGLAFLGDRASRGTEVRHLEITGGNSYPAAGNLRIFVDPTDSRGSLVPGRIASVQVTGTATVTQQPDGSFLISGGARNDDLVVTAQLDGIVRRFPVKVT